MDGHHSGILSKLRSQLSMDRTASGPGEGSRRISLGSVLDEALGGGLERGALHEVYASQASDSASATGFAVALAAMADDARPILWVRQDFLNTEAGRLHASGLAEFGLNPSQIILVSARDAASVLKAGWEGARCNGLSIAVIEPWGNGRQLDLRVSRRLCLAARESGVTVVMLLASTPRPSAAWSRWSVGPAGSRALDANAPGFPAFSVNLLRHRGGVAGREWQLEWDRDAKLFRESLKRFEPPLSRPLVPRPAQRPLASSDEGLRKTG